MIRNRGGIVNVQQTTKVNQEKTFETTVTNYACLFCNINIFITNIHEAKCACGSQWFEKKKGKKVKVCEAV
jgi:hypothetical protein